MSIPATMAETVMCVYVRVCVCVCARTSFATCIISKMFGTCLWCLYGTKCPNKLLKWNKMKMINHSLAVHVLFYKGYHNFYLYALVFISPYILNQRLMIVYKPHAGIDIVSPSLYTCSQRRM